MEKVRKFIIGILAIGCFLPRVDVHAMQNSAGEDDTKAVETIESPENSQCAKAKSKEAMMIRAAFHGHCELVKVLLEENVDCNIRNGLGVTALHGAADQGHVDIIKLLIDHKADINALSNNGHSALYGASFSRKKDAVRVLLAAKAEVNTRDRRDSTPLSCAAEAGCEDIAKLLLEAKANIHEATEGGYTALHAAAYVGHADIARLLLAHKADVDSASKRGTRPLHLASLEGCIGVVEALLASKATVDARDDETGYTSLCSASIEGHLDIVNALLDKSADVHIQFDSKGLTPLALALGEAHARKDEYGNYPGVVKRLLACGLSKENQEEGYAIACKLQLHAMMPLFSQHSLSDVKGDSTRIVGSSVANCSFEGCHTRESAPSLQVCGKCKKVAYCGRTCQVADWKAKHKTECASMQLLSTSASAVQMLGDSAAMSAAAIDNNRQEVALEREPVASSMACQKAVNKADLINVREPLVILSDVAPVTQKTISKAQLLVEVRQLLGNISYAIKPHIQKINAGIALKEMAKALTDIQLATLNCMQAVHLKKVFPLAVMGVFNEAIGLSCLMQQRFDNFKQCIPKDGHMGSRKTGGRLLNNEAKAKVALFKFQEALDNALSSFMPGGQYSDVSKVDIEFVIERLIKELGETLGILLASMEQLRGGLTADAKVFQQFIAPDSCHEAKENYDALLACIKTAGQKGFVPTQADDTSQHKKEDAPARALPEGGSADEKNEEQAGSNKALLKKKRYKERRAEKEKEERNKRELLAVAQRERAQKAQVIHELEIMRVRAVEAERREAVSVAKEQEERAQIERKMERQQRSKLLREAIERENRLEVGQFVRNGYELAGEDATRKLKDSMNLLLGLHTNSGAKVRRPEVQKPKKVRGIVCAHSVDAGVDASANKKGRKGNKQEKKIGKGNIQHQGLLDAGTNPKSAGSWRPQHARDRSFPFMPKMDEMSPAEVAFYREEILKKTSLVDEIGIAREQGSGSDDMKSDGHAYNDEQVEAGVQLNAHLAVLVDHALLGKIWIDCEHIFQEGGLHHDQGNQLFTQGDLRVLPSDFDEVRNGCYRAVDSSGKVSSFFPSQWTRQNLLERLGQVVCSSKVTVYEEFSSRNGGDRVDTCIVGIMPKEVGDSGDLALGDIYFKAIIKWYGDGLIRTVYPITDTEYAFELSRIEQVAWARQERARGDALHVGQMESLLSQQDMVHAGGKELADGQQESEQRVQEEQQADEHNADAAVLEMQANHQEVEEQSASRLVSSWSFVGDVR